MTSKPNVLPPVTMLFIAVTLAFSMPALASDPEKSDLDKAATAKGCKLIPYETLRNKCMAANDGLHEPAACRTQACQKSAGRDVNQQRLNSFTECVAKREASNMTFSQTTEKLIAIKRNTKKSYSPDYKKALDMILTKIKDGTPGHKKALMDAQTALQDCKKYI